MEVALVEAEIADLEATLKERKAYLTEIKLVQALENRLMT